MDAITTSTVFIETAPQMADTAWTLGEQLLTIGLGALGLSAAWIGRIMIVVRATVRPMFWDWLYSYANIAIPERARSEIDAGIVKDLFLNEAGSRLKFAKNPIGKAILGSAVEGIMKDHTAGTARKVKSAVSLVGNANKVGLEAAHDGDKVKFKSGLTIDTKTGMPNVSVGFKW